ncbi:chaperonin 10-like protein [Cladorrhinum sp. PSN259]|nr:chaperonin 10-like protein [Cladorrhinum sp. PSN259]
MASMKAVVITQFGGPEVLEHQTVPKPDPVPGEALIRVRAFGLNHAEIHMRRGEWDEWNPITGLECVGLVDACPGGELAVGTKVIGVMGGMGRNRPGGYGEFVNVPLTNVAAVQTSLPWEELAVVPEVYSTAWTCLFTILDLHKGERLLIRGATSTIGQAAVHLAYDAGSVITATTRQRERFAMLRQIGASDIKVERNDIGAQFEAPPRFDKVLNLIGNSVMVESIGLARAGGRVLQAGWLGGLAPVKDFNPMLEMESGVHFSLFHSKMLGSPSFPVSGIPLQEIVTKIEHGAWDAKPSRVFDYDNIQDAHRMLDSQAAGGKIVVRH